MSIFSLFLFQLRTLPAIAWVFFVMQFGLLPLSLIGPGSGVRSGFATLLLDPLSLMNVIGLGLVFFRKPSHLRGSRFAPMPPNEFILTRPVSPRRVYYISVSLYFIIVLGIPLALPLIGLNHPDLRFSLFDDGVSRTDAAEHLAAYRAAFPGNAILESPGGKHPVLLLPNAYIAVLFWNLAVVAGIATAFQVVGAFRYPFRWIVSVCGMLGFLLFVKPGVLHSAFLAFAADWKLCGASLLLLIAAVQIFIWKRTARIGME